jgi:hypothetical protein
MWWYWIWKVQGPVRDLPTHSADQRRRRMNNSESESDSSGTLAISSMALSATEQNTPTYHRV